MGELYMCYVDGRNNPIRKHTTSQAAADEALRLSKLPENIGRDVFVLRLISRCRTSFETAQELYGQWPAHPTGKEEQK